MVLLFGSGIRHDDLSSVLQNFLHEWVDGSHASGLLQNTAPSAETPEVWLRVQTWITVSSPAGASRELWELRAVIAGPVELRLAALRTRTPGALFLQR